MLAHLHLHPLHNNNITDASSFSSTCRGRHSGRKDLVNQRRGPVKPVSIREIQERSRFGSPRKMCVQKNFTQSTLRPVATEWPVSGWGSSKECRERKKKGFRCGPLANLYKGLILMRYLRVVVRKDICVSIWLLKKKVPSCGCSDRPYARGDDENVNRFGQRPVREMN